MEDAAELIRHEPVEHAVIYSPAGKALYYVRSVLSGRFGFAYMEI